MQPATHDNDAPRNRHERRAAEAGAPRLAYTINDFAEASGMSRSSVYAAIRSGQLKAKRLGCRTYIPAPNAFAFFDTLPDVSPAEAA